MSDETILRSKVPPLQAGQSLAHYLSSRFRYQTLEAWHGLILSGKVTLNGVQAAPGRILQKGDSVEYQVVLQEPPVDRNIEIIHEEKNFLVASKPGQLPSHADGNFIKNTFIYILTEKMRAQGYPGELKLVHRLDRETSGLLIVAKEEKRPSEAGGSIRKGLSGKRILGGRPRPGGGGKIRGGGRGNPG